MPEKYIRRDDLPLLVRHTGRTTLAEQPPAIASGPVVVCLHDAGSQDSVFEALLGELDAADCNAIAFDMSGHGRFGSLDALATIEDVTEMTSWVGFVATDDQLGVRRFVPA